jgi:hypothetical protein
LTLNHPPHRRSNHHRRDLRPRDVYGTPGPYEDAVQNTPIFEENRPDKFKGIDIMRAVRNFDPCLPCGVHMFKRRRQAAGGATSLDLFGTPERWGQTVRPMPWTNVGGVVSAFAGSAATNLTVPCSYDFSLAATKYFAALDDGDLPLCFLFSGTVFYVGEEGELLVDQISWQKEASFRLPAATWRGLMELYYPNCAWLCLRKDVFDALAEYRSREGLPTWEHALERLLSIPSPQRLAQALEAVAQ